jgi:ketosteroid isomerase-like protein
MTAIERELIRLERKQVNDFNRHSVPALLSHFDRKFVGFSSTRHERVSGAAQLARTFRHYMSVSPKVRYAISQPKVQVLGESAVVSFYWKVQLAPGHSIDGRGSHVFARKGKLWKIVHEHFSRSRGA